MSAFQQAPKLPREPTLIRDQALTANPATPPRLTSTQSPPSPPPFPESLSTTDHVSPSSIPHPTVTHFPKLQIYPAVSPQHAAESPAPPVPKLSSDTPKEMPLPPKFPSIHDEPAWTSPQSSQTPVSAQVSNASPVASTAAPNSEASPTQPTHAVSWNRASSDNLSASLSQQPLQPEQSTKSEEKKGVFAKVVAMFKPNKNQLSETSEPASPSKPPLQKVKDIICKLPDPTLIFVLQASIILLLHTFVPHVLRSWPARIVIPLFLVPTVAATAFWRRTIVIVKPGKSVLSIVKPVPNAGRVVSKGGTLRAREAAVIAAEEKVKEGQVRLEVLRKEIEARLPPQDSITSLLESDKRAQEAS
ncbi:unnamed protein product [Agarophyton chilense]